MCLHAKTIMQHYVVLDSGEKLVFGAQGAAADTLGGQ